MSLALSFSTVNRANRVYIRVFKCTVMLCVLNNSVHSAETASTLCLNNKEVNSLQLQLLQIQDGNLLTSGLNIKHVGLGIDF